MLLQLCCVARAPRLVVVRPRPCLDWGVSMDVTSLGEAEVSPF